MMAMFNPWRCFTYTLTASLGRRLSRPAASVVGRFGKHIEVCVPRRGAKHFIITVELPSLSRLPKS